MQYPVLAYTSPVKLNQSCSNYEEWKIQMIYLIHRQGLLCFINGTIVLPMTYQDYQTDMLLKQGILSQLDNNIDSIDDVANRPSRDILFELEERFHNPTTGATLNYLVGHNQQNNVIMLRKHNDFLEIYRDATRGYWWRIQQIFRGHINPVIDPRIVSLQAKALFIAVITGKNAIPSVKYVMQIIPNHLLREVLSVVDEIGDSILSIAAAVGNREAAILAVNKKPDLLHIPNKLGIFPVHTAAIHAKKPMLSYLISQHIAGNNLEGNNPCQGASGLMLLISVIEAGFFDIALHLVETYPDLATLKVASNSALKAITEKMSIFTVTLHSQPEFLSLFSSLTKKIFGRDQKKKIGLKLVKFLCTRMRYIHFSDAEDIYRDAIMIAARSDIHEIVKEIVKRFPNAIYYCDPSSFQSIFHVAVENRSENTLRFLYRKSDNFKQLYLDLPDIDGNNLLHLAAKLPASHKINEISNSAIQMQYEVLWYKKIEKLVHHHSTARLNHAGKTSNVLFIDEHKNLIQKGQKWIKETNNSCIIAATLICSIMFAASITVPGGNDGDTGVPMFSHRRGYLTFRFMYFHSLAFAVGSLIVFLITSTLPYTERYFLYLPTLLYVGLASLVASVSYMLLSFFSAFDLNAPPGRKPPRLVNSIKVTFGLSVLLLVHLLLGVFQMPLIILWRTLFLSMKRGRV